MGSSKLWGTGVDEEREWQIARRDEGWDMKGAGMGLLRFTLLFGLCAAALAVVVAPTLERRTENWVAANGRIDPIAVGSTAQKNIYTIRKSVLQMSPQAECRLWQNGTRSGDC